ncbi:hypothetical protein [Anabaena sp. CCY 9910]|uniref:hypothetical protein n=1 Tax=Anabaena sp. CCY 9910 TaxID=3103870 RepID=UPI0039E0D0E7
MRFFKKLLIVTAISLGFGIASAGSSQAARIQRSEFNASAINVDFESSPMFQRTVSDGNLTVSNGVVSFAGPVPDDYLSGKSYYDGGDSSVIRFDFLNPVSAVGTNFLAAYYSNTTLSIFDSANRLIESLTLRGFGLPTVFSSPYGFIGLNAGSNLIAYATIDTPLNGSELFVDNIIYQTENTTAVPEPSFISSLLGVAFFLSLKRKEQAKSAKIG